MDKNIKEIHENIEALMERAKEDMDGRAVIIIATKRVDEDKKGCHTADCYAAAGNKYMCMLGLKNAMKNPETGIAELIKKAAGRLAIEQLARLLDDEEKTESETENDKED